MVDLPRVERTAREKLLTAAHYLGWPLNGSNAHDRHFWVSLYRLVLGKRVVHSEDYKRLIDFATSVFHGERMQPDCFHEWHEKKHPPPATSGLRRG